MTRQEWWKQHAHVTDAYYKYGAEIEVFDGESKEWHLVDLPAWNVDTFYRIKKEMKKEPTDTGEPAYSCGKVVQ